MGGEFDQRELPTGPVLPWASPHRMYGLAQHALIAAWEALPAIPTRTLHVPDYFCPEVVTAWRQAGIRIQEYPDDPRWLEPVWSLLSPDPDDAVLAVNYFGVRSQDGWLRWQVRHRNVLMVEDHSHDPMSVWARRSVADLAFASLRKTLPISDGAILWSPRGRTLPGAPPNAIGSGADRKWKAMVLKHKFLDSDPVDKATFRTLQLQGERDLLAGPVSAITLRSQRFIAHGVPATWRHRRRRNVQLLIDLVAGTTGMRPLFTTWPRGHIPFNLVLLFPNQARRDACRAYLIDRSIYPPIHWAQPADASDRVRALASVVLTVPADQRYGAPDVRCVAAALLSFDAMRATRAR